MTAPHACGMAGSKRDCQRYVDRHTGPGYEKPRWTDLKGGRWQVTIEFAKHPAIGSKRNEGKP